MTFTLKEGVSHLFSDAENRRLPLISCQSKRPFRWKTHTLPSICTPIVSEWAVSQRWQSRDMEGMADRRSSARKERWGDLEGG